MDDQPARYFAPELPASDDVRPRPIRPDEHDEDDVAHVVPPPGDTRPPRGGGLLRNLLWLILVAVIVIGIVWWVMNRHQTAPANRFGSGPQPVGTATAVQGNMPVIDNALGTVTPLATVTVQTQINGQLTEVGFTEGQMVKKDDFLAQIDPRPYQVALEQAQGQLAKDQASLADAQLDLARYTKLVAQNSLASQQLDTQRALVEQDKGQVITDQAQVDVQKLNLVYCHIISPVTGRVGLRQVDPGNYIQTSSTTGIVVVTQLQPISVIFTLPEDSLPKVLDKVNGGATLQAVAFDRSGTKQLETGQLQTLDNQIDTTTGTVKMRAVFPNANLNLFPNQFVNIALQVDTLSKIATVPSSAIQRGAPGTFVYLVDIDKKTVSIAKVTVGPDDGTNVAILDGLSPGQVVVTDGADRLKDGSSVELASSSAPGQTKRGQAKGVGQGNGDGQGKGGDGQGKSGDGQGKNQGQNQSGG
jgi:membrane fusion protein, multidrug efflux system